MTTLQQHIIETLGVKPTINPAEEIRKRIDFLKEFTKKSATRGYVLGISGGQDSALAGKLAQMAVAELRAETGDDNYEFVALLLPYGIQKDAEEAAFIAKKFIQADETINFNIKDTVDAFQNTFNTVTVLDDATKNLTDYHKGNVKARVRMITEYAYAGEKQLLVVSSDHASEGAGFWTKHGDGAADLAPLVGLNKRQGKQLLRLLNAPEFVLTKAPTADLLDLTPQQADETELGLTYNQIDDYLEGKKIEEAAAMKYEAFYLKNEHKRQLIATPDDMWWK